jgi:hypothetical protein
MRLLPARDAERGVEGWCERNSCHWVRGRSLEGGGLSVGLENEEDCERIATRGGGACFGGLGDCRHGEEQEIGDGYAGVHMRLIAAAIIALAVPAFAQQAITWRFDNLTKVGETQVTSVGTPQVVDTSIGKAIHFEGHGNADSSNPQSGNPSGDALFLNAAPLSGDATYTFEVIFRPSSKGAPAQRFFHMQDNNSQSRRMFEIRIVNKQWCLDTVGIDVGHGPEQHGVALVCDAAHLHPLDRWYAVAATYDGKTLRGYVDGEPQGEINVMLAPLPPGTTSVGTRIDKRDFFTGDIYSARFTPSVLSAADFLKVPDSARH